MEFDASPETFGHARIIVGIVTGFSMARLLTGVAADLQRGRAGGGWLQYAWAGFLLISVTQFWWFEVGAQPTGGWSYGVYLYALCYVSLFFFTCATLFPDRPPEGGFAAYLGTRRLWFYGLLVALAAADAGFAAMKGAGHVAALGPLYGAKQAALAGLALAGMALRRERSDAVVVVASVALQLLWAARFVGLIA